MTLEKILQSQGFGSRKFCRNLVLGHRVEIAGKICTDPDRKLETDDLAFRVDGETWEYREKLYLVLNKPAGYECSRQPQHHPSVFALLPEPFVQRGLQCVGRLDQDTTGLLLLTDDGHFIHQYTSPRKKVPKIYTVTGVSPFEATQLEKLVTGVQLKDEKTLTSALACQLIDEYRLRLSITEGKYHQVKRMIAAAGNRVETLHRSAIGGFTLEETLLPGHWRFLNENDLKRLSEPFPA
ncbi:pseudouridine synthase [Oxalobacter paraformigenes]|nr:pseudouridine synthase [Oxalobacter paraformigenes]